MVDKIFPVVLMHKSSKYERADQVVSMNTFLMAIRIFIVITVIGFIAVGVIVWDLTKQGSKQDELIKSNQDSITTGRANRLADQADLQKQLDNFICSIVDRIKPGDTVIDKFRTDYNCGPYIAPATGTSAPSALPSATPSATPTRLASATPQSLPTIGPSAPPSSSISSSTAIQTINATRTAVAPSNSPAIINLPTLCVLPGVCL
jgi:hypothetical protein